MSARVVYGVHPVEELLRAGTREVQALWAAASRATESDPVEKLRRQAQQRRLQIQPATAEELDALCGSANHQGVVAIVGEYRYCALEDLLEDSALLVVVDGVTDPQNLGAMMRSAAVLGATGMVLTRDRCAQVNATVVRVSSGASEHLRCARVTNLARAIRSLKEHGIWVAATVERGGSAPAEVDFCAPTAVVVGSEQRGIRSGVLKLCDLRVTIPGRGRLAALNVASATSVVLYEADRQRRAAPRSV